MKSTRPVVLANTERVDFRSAVNGRAYSISVALPLARAPEAGCPVLYVLDGQWYLASAVEAVRANAPEVVVVGIGYPDDEAYVESVLERYRPLPTRLEEAPASIVAAGLERIYDLSLPASNEALAADFPAEHVPASKDVGGLDDFLETIENEVKPRIAAMTSVDSSNQAIFGHSLGGLAVVHALFVRPNAYRTFVASSPSIWWNSKSVLAGEAKFAEAVRTSKATARLLVTMGSEEETPDPKVAAHLKVDFARYTALLRRHRMVKNARELTERLKALRRPGAFEVDDYALFPNQHHGISPWPALGRAVAFAFAP